MKYIENISKNETITNIMIDLVAEEKNVDISDNIMQIDKDERACEDANYA